MSGPVEGTAVNGYRERELKLEAARGFRLARMQSPLDEYAVSPVALQRLHTVYYDTRDYRLARWGCSLRFRYGEGWTLKIPLPAETGLTRDEHAVPGDGADIPAGLLDLASAYIRAERLLPVAELRTLRANRNVLSKSGASIASLAEDDVHVLDGTAVVERFRQIEVELQDGAPPSLLDDLGRQLRRRGAGKSAAASKNVRALGARSCEPEIRLPGLHSASTIGDVLVAALGDCVEDIVRFDSALRSKPNSETIHRARVAVRRLRSHLRTFVPVLDESRARELGARLSWLQDGLSEARDADVFLAGLRRLGANLPDGDRRDIEHVVFPFEEARDRAYQRLQASLREPRYLTLLDDIIEAAQRPPLAIDATLPAREFVPLLIDCAWSKTAQARAPRRRAAIGPQTARHPHCRQAHALSV